MFRFSSIKIGNFLIDLFLIDLKLLLDRGFAARKLQLLDLSRALQSGEEGGGATDLLFWYQVFTCVSLRQSSSATSLLSATLKYFWQRNLRSRKFSWPCATTQHTLRTANTHSQTETFIRAIFLTFHVRVVLGGQMGDSHGDID